MQPPAPPPGSGDNPGWERDQSPYGQQPAAAPPPAYGGYQQPVPPPGYQPYGQPGYGGHGGGEHPQGTTILVLGVLSLVLCQVLGPFAWSMGNKALKEIDSSPTSYNNRGTIVAGKICGMISTILMIVAIGIILIAIVIAAAAGSSS